MLMPSATQVLRIVIMTPNGRLLEFGEVGSARQYYLDYGALAITAEFLQIVTGDSVDHNGRSVSKLDSQSKVLWGTSDITSVVDDCCPVSAIVDAARTEVQRSEVKPLWT